MTLPNDFSYATALTRLDLSSNRLRHLPLDFGLLFSLQVINHPTETIYLKNYVQPPLSPSVPTHQKVIILVL